MLDAEVRGAVELRTQVEKLASDLHGPKMVQAMRESALLVTADAKKRAPVDTGRLRASITPEIRVDGTDVIGVVGSNVQYAAAVELGSKPHFPPVKALEVWARRKGINPYVVAMAIAKKGTKPKKFLGDAFKAQKSIIQTKIERVVAKVVDLFNKG